MTVAITPAPVPSPGERLVPARVDGAELHIPCPPWCAVDHVMANPRFLADVSHDSRSVDVAVPVGCHTESVLQGWVTEAPYLSGSASTRGLVFAFDASGSGEVAELTKTKALATLDQLAAHIDALRSVAEQMP